MVTIGAATDIRLARSRTPGNRLVGDGDHRTISCSVRTPPQTRHRLLTNFGVPDEPLNQKLTAWWELDFAGLRTELQKVFKRDIPLKERDEWEEWFAARQDEHQQRTAEIIRLETDLNSHLYALFDLKPEEIQIIEESTKYRYGEV